MVNVEFVQTSSSGVVDILSKISLPHYQGTTGALEKTPRKSGRVLRLVVVIGHATLKMTKKH